MKKINILALIFRYHRFKLLIFLISFTVLLNTLIYTHVFSVFKIVQDHDIHHRLVTHNFAPLDKPFCIPVNFTNAEILNPTMDVPDDLSRWASSIHLLEGGEWTPSHCTPRYLVAIIIPYRNRTEHLKILLYNIHPFLQQQNIHYKIFVVEQNDDKDFNRGKLFNVGFVEALKDQPYPCFIFHDVDLIPQNLNNIYACTEFPRHMSSSIDKFRYKVPYDRNFGGVISILTDQFKETNGFSNKFFGWGGEDDDFFWRVRHAGYQLIRFNQHISRYKSLPHELTKPNENRLQMLNNGYGAYESDGLSSLKYNLKAAVDTPTYVRIVVEL